MQSSSKERGESFLGHVVSFLWSQAGAACGAVNLARIGVDDGCQGVRVT